MEMQQPLDAAVGRDSIDWTREYQAILQAYEQAGGSPAVLRAGRVAALVVNANRVLGIINVPGVTIDAEPLSDGVQVRIVAAPGACLDRPVHLCFGMTAETGVQRVIADYEIGAGAQVEFLAHCTFPNARDLQHTMEAQVHVGEGACLRYTEAHYHGPYGGVVVEACADVTVAAGGRYFSTFSLTHGRVGRLLIDYTADVDDSGVVDLASTVYGTGNDDIEVREAVRLNGRGARGLAKTRIAVRDQAHSRVFTTAEGNAPGTRGHMDCAEIVRGNAVAKNVPTVIVRNDSAHITHEAAIGSVNQKELETLMARGLDEDTAVDVIIRGMLGQL
ncbi:MAG: SufD family Fe-S cluster assembly protein [Roseiflexus sp.]|uniref:SufB/SufD family protein n=1 Tax=Roseiflexus sp. TaxID=2562120 RepID=UPI0025CE68CD|nr:SufD family Fe-S cluster assembly protein [Roseiflexus sp.]MCL6540223.1 SufD family Fe-S cluster assembly protein [Roseiflexus sp.]